MILRNGCVRLAVLCLKVLNVWGFKGSGFAC